HPRIALDEIVIVAREPPDHDGGVPEVDARTDGDAEGLAREPAQRVGPVGVDGARALRDRGAVGAAQILDAKGRREVEQGVSPRDGGVFDADVAVVTPAETDDACRWERVGRHEAAGDDDELQMRAHRRHDTPELAVEAPRWRHEPPSR